MKPGAYLIAVSALALTACTDKPTNIEAPKSMDPAASGWTEKSLPELSAAMANGEISSEDLVSQYLARIAAIDHSGFQLQSVLTLNPDALVQAKRADQRRTEDQTLGSLNGIPILLKDNIETNDDMPTTAGALALKDNFTRRDSPLVAGLRAEGAIILGKTNLSQWANFRSNDSMSGWSALGGQTKNPHILDRNPCGSSSGSGAAIAASLAAGAVGTETNGSIICPSNANGVVGFKPTVGLVPQDFIVPISSSQDTAGPMTKTVTGAAMMLGAMDNQDVDYVAGLSSESLQGVRIGVLRFAEGSNPDINARFNAAIEHIKGLGANIVEIDAFEPDTKDFWGKSLKVLKYEFKATLNDYLENSPAKIPVRSLSEVIAYNNANSDLELALFGQDILESSDEMEDLISEDYIGARDDIQMAAGEIGLDKMITDYNVDVLIAPSGPVAGRTDPINGDVWPSWAGAGYLAAIAGYPHLTVPMGEIHQMPIGLSFMAGKDMDAKVLSYGYAYEQATNHRKDPGYLPTAEVQPDIEKAMTRKD